MKKVMVFGTFDILHPGHIHALKEAKKYGDFLVVIVARDQTVNSVKARPPVHDEVTRLNNLRALNIANLVRLGNLDDKYAVIREEKPDVIALGYDQKAFTDDLAKIMGDKVPIVRLSAYQPEIYKSSKIRASQGI